MNALTEISRIFYDKVAWEISSSDSFSFSLEFWNLLKKRKYREENNRLNVEYFFSQHFNFILFFRGNRMQECNNAKKSYGTFFLANILAKTGARYYKPI